MADQVYSLWTIIGTTILGTIGGIIAGRWAKRS